MALYESFSSKDCPLADDWLTFILSIVQKSNLQRFVLYWYVWKVIWLCWLIGWHFLCATLEKWPRQCPTKQNFGSVWGAIWFTCKQSWNCCCESICSKIIPIPFSLIVWTLLEMRRFSEDLIQNFILKSWHAKLLHRCCVRLGFHHKNTEIQISYENQDTYFLTECSLWSEANCRVFSMDCWKRTASTNFSVFVWVVTAAVQQCVGLNVNISEKR